MSRQVDVKALISHIVRGDGADKCRICMGDTSEGQVYLGDTVMMDGDKPVSLSELLETITGVEVECLPTQPHTICKLCMVDFLAALPLIQLARDSTRKWDQIINFLSNYEVPDKTKNVYVIVEDNNVEAITDTVKSVAPKATNKTQAFKNFKMRLRRKKAQTMRMWKSYEPENIESDCYQCPECSIMFTKSTFYNRHIKILGLKCCFLCKKVVRIAKFDEHLRRHGKQAFKCKICFDAFTKRSALDTHFQKNHKKEWEFCSYCRKSFVHLSSHGFIHEPQVCRGCNKKFSNKTCFRLHLCPNRAPMFSHYICDYCSEKFTKKQMLRVHIRIKHVNKREFQCDICGKNFINRQGLEEHDNIHNKILDRYVCPLCGLKYSTRRGYEKHMHRHNGKTYTNNRKKYECPICGVQLSAKFRLAPHMKSKHNIVASEVGDHLVP